MSTSSNRLLKHCTKGLKHLNEELNRVQKINTTMSTMGCLFYVANIGRDLRGGGLNIWPKECWLISSKLPQICHWARTNQKQAYPFSSRLFIMNLFLSIAFDCSMENIQIFSKIDCIFEWNTFHEACYIIFFRLWDKWS